MDQKEAGLEKRPIDQDLELKTRELDLKQRELDLKERELTGKNTRWLTPQQATILVAVIGIVAAAIGSIVQGILSQRLERDRFRTSLILKAVETGDRKQASDNLLRLFEWHLIDDPDGHIVEAIKHEPSAVPVLPRADSDSAVKVTKPAATIPPVDIDKPGGATKTVVKTFYRSDLVAEPGVVGDAHRFSIVLTAPGPIADVRVSIEGEGAPWFQTERIEKTDDTHWKWVGRTNSGAPVALIFTIKYHAPSK